MPECQYCQKSLGNEGAKSSHEAHCEHNPANQADTAQPAPKDQSPQGGADEQPPAQQSSDPVEMGMQLGQSLAGLRADDPEAKAEAEGKVAKAVGATVAQFGEQVAKEKISQVREAKRRSGDELQKSQEFPECPHCDKPIQHVPQGTDAFDCPHCGTRLEWA